MTDPRLAQLAKYLTDFESSTTQVDFWAGWDRVAGDLSQQVWAGGADTRSRTTWSTVRVNAMSSGSYRAPSKTLLQRAHTER